MEIAFMKKNPGKQFRIVEEAGDQIKLVEIDEDLHDKPGTEKEIKQTTFKRSYGRKEVGSKPASTAEKEEEDNPEHRYWYHPESESAVMTITEEQAQKVASDGCVELSREEYEGIIEQQLSQEAQEDTEKATEDPVGPKIPVDRPEAKEDTREGAGDISEIQEDPLPSSMDGPGEQKKSNWNLTPIAPSRATQIEDRERAFAEAKPFVPNPFSLRQSMVNTYLQCPARFYAIYEEGKEDPGSKFTEMGTAVHAVLEAYYKGEFQRDDLTEAFDYWWTKYGPNDFKDYQECLDMIRRYFDRNPEDPEVIATELDFNVTVNGIPLSGTIDRIDRIDERTIRLVDYKTNQMPFSKDDLEGSIQFKMYNLALMELKDQLGGFDRIINTYEMLRLDYAQSVEYTQEELTEFAQWLKVIWTKILSGVDREARPHQYCIYNPISDKCKELNRKLLDGVEEPADTIEGLVEQLEVLKVQEKLVKARRGEVETLIKEAISQQGGEITIGDRIWTTRSQARTVYPADKVIRILAMHGHSDKIPDLVNINATSLKRTFKDNQEILNIIESVAETNYTAPSIISRKRR